MEDDREPPGTDGEVEETDTQPLDENDIAGENPQDFQEVESQDNESAGPNSSFEKPAEHRKRHSRSHKERSSRHGRSHRKHHSSRHSKRSSREEIVYDEEYLYPDEGEKEPSRTMVKEADAEDGEILEDGEIASDEGDDRLPGMGVQRSMDDDEGNSDGENPMGDQEDLPDDDEDMAPRDPRPRRFNKRKRKDKRKDRDDKRKKPRRHEYIDHDRAEDEEGGRWPSYPGGPDGNFYQSPSRRRDPRDSYYYNGGDSPPGLYDSPSDESDDDINSQPSLTSLVAGDYLDASVAVGEKEHPKMKGMKPVRERKRGGRSRRKDGRHMEPPKKKLVEIPMAERPVCKFYKDGKCAKGVNCPFNHDALRNRRLEPCKFHVMQSGCNKGDSCIYMHEDYPCKYFHTGQKCFAGDKCRFSHEPLNELTRKIIDDLLNKDDGMSSADASERADRPKKPSLLGSPPRHIKEAMERVKKIPSLFDIEVFPPGQKQKMSGFYTERGDSSSPPPDSSPTRPTQGQGPMSSSPSPSLLGTPPQNVVRGPNAGGMMQQGNMMIAGPQGPMNRPMMGPQRPVFGGMQQGMKPGMQQGMNMNQGMNPNMNQGMNPNMNQNMNPNMNQNMNQGMNQNMNQGMNPNMSQGMNQGMTQNMNPGMNQNMNPGMNQNMNPGMNQNMNPGMNQNMNPGMMQQGPRMQQGAGVNPAMNTNMEQNANQGMNQNMQQGMNQNMQPGMNQGMQQGMNQGMQQGMNQGAQQNMNQGMPQGMNQGMQPGMNQGMQPGMNQAMQQRMPNPALQQGINPAMMQQGMNPNMQQAGMNMNQQGMSPMPGMMNQQGMNPNMRGMNPNMIQGMNRVMNPNMPGMATARFGMGTQTTSAMPSVFNMISTLLQRTSTSGPFNQNSPQGPIPSQSPMMPQDTDMRTTEDTGDTDLRKGIDGNRPDPRMAEQQTIPDGQQGSVQESAVEKLASDVPGDSGRTSPVEKNQSMDSEQAIPGSSDDRDRAVSPRYNAEEDVGSSMKEKSAGDDSFDDGEEKATCDSAKPCDEPQLSPDDASKEETDSDNAKLIIEDKDESMDIAMHLPPMQRQLFMRIRQQQLHHDQQQQKEEPMESEDSPSPEDSKTAEEKSAEDDDWYSSDDDEAAVSKKKLSDILKTIAKTSASSSMEGTNTATTVPVSSATSSTALSSTFSVMQMIQSVRSQAQSSQQSALVVPDIGETTTAPTGAQPPKDPHQRQTDPRSARSTPGSMDSGVTSGGASTSVPLPVLPTLFVDPPVIDGMPKKTIVYRMTPLSVRAVKPYWSLPASVDTDDPERKKDPRVQAHFTLVEKRGHEPKTAPPPTKVSDPRLSRKASANVEEAGSSSPRPQDPRMRRAGGKDPRLAPQDPRSQNVGRQDPRTQNIGPQDPRGQNLGPQDPRAQNMGPQDPRNQNRMANMGGQDQWMGGGGMMGPDARMMGAGGSGGGMNMNMMQNPNNSGPGFQGNMMQGPRGMMPGQGEVWNGPMRMGAPMNMQGPMGMQQGPMGGPMGMNMQGPMNMQGRPMGMNQGPINMQGGMMNMQGNPMGMQQGQMGMQQGPMGMQDPRRGPMNMQGPMGMQQANMGMQQQGNMGMQQQGNMGLPQGNMGMAQGNMGMQPGGLGMPPGNMGMPPGNMGMQQGNINMQQGNNMGMQQGNVGMPQGNVGNQQDPRQNPAGNSDPRQTPSIQRNVSDPRQRGQSGRVDPREGRSSALDPRMSRVGHDSPQASPSSQSPRRSEPSASPSHPSVLEDSASTADSAFPLKQSDGVGRDSDVLPGSGSFSLPPALRELPSRSEPDPSTGDDGSASEENSVPKKRFDHRNDPRFKRKRATENKSEKVDVPAESSEERSRKFMGQRKSSMEYASPLGGGDDSGSLGSGYNSYNRPPQPRQDPRKRKTVTSDSEKPFELPRMELPPLLSKQPPPLPDNMAPPEMMPEEPEQQLKDLFKTIDPTASPFC